METEARARADGVLKGHITGFELESPVRAPVIYSMYKALRTNADPSIESSSVELQEINRGTHKHSSVNTHGPKLVRAGFVRTWSLCC